MNIAGESKDQTFKKIRTLNFPECWDLFLEGVFGVNKGGLQKKLILGKGSWATMIWETLTKNTQATPANSV